MCDSADALRRSSIAVVEETLASFGNCVWEWNVFHALAGLREPELPDRGASVAPDWPQIPDIGTQALEFL
jgi:hypothetical protein